MIIGGAATGLLSGLAGSGGPVGAAAFLTLGLPPVAYIASEATTATAMHILKTVIYSKLVGLDLLALLTGLAMGAAMIAGTFAANTVSVNLLGCGLNGMRSFLMQSYAFLGPAQATSFTGSHDSSQIFNSLKTAGT